MNKKLTGRGGHSPASIAFFALLYLTLNGPLSAQPRPGYAPSSTHIYPAGGPRGTTVQVLVGTECAPPATRLSLFGEGISASDVLGKRVLDVGEPSPRRAPTETPITYPREWQSAITIAPDAPTGVAFWQLCCAQGGTASRPFVIGELPEHLEAESNSVATRAEKIVLPVTVNGRINGERDVDYFRFSAAAGQIVTCEMLARRLGSPLDPLLQVLDDRGRPLPVDETYAGNDPVRVLRVPRDGEYLLRIASVTKLGNPANVYRVNLTTKPFVATVFPAGGRAGQTETLEVSALTGDGALQTSLVEVDFPASSGPFQLQLPEFSGTFTLVAADVEHRRDDQPNETRATAQSIVLPGAIDGRFEAPRDVDWFAFTAAPATSYALVCRPFPTWGDCLPSMVLVDAEGQEVARQESIDAEDGVARIHWKSQAAGRYFVRVRDARYGISGGPTFVYRLTVREASPDFELRLASDNLDVLPGESATVEVKVVRRDGFLGPVQLRFRDLPIGVTMAAANVAAKADSAKIKLSVAKHVPLGSRRVELVGQARIGGKTVQRVALADHSGVDSQGQGIGPARLPHLQLTVRHAPLFRLHCAEAYQYAHRGSIYPYQMEVERLDGFNGEIVLQIGDRQNRDLDGIEMIETVIAAGETTAQLPIYLPETMHINIQSQSQLYSQGFAWFTDRQGRRQSQLILSEKRNMLRTLPPVVKLVALDETLVAQPGAATPCRLRLDRTSNFAGPMQLELRGGGNDEAVHVEPMTIAAGATDVVVPLQVAANCGGGEFKLTFRATGTPSAEIRAVTEATVRLVVASP